MAEIVPRYNTTNDYSPINSLVVGTGVASDTVDLAAGVSRGFMVTAAGNIKIDTANGETVVLAIPATALAQWIPVRVKRLYATGGTIAAASVFVAY